MLRTLSFRGLNTVPNRAISTMKAVWVSRDERILKDYPIPHPDENEVLIKNLAIASNPKDFKVPIWQHPYSAVEGNDISGHIETVGSAVSGFKKGDKVAAFTKMRSGDKYGAYAEYSVSPANTVFHLGPQTSFEEAAALPLSYMTAAIGLFRRLGLPTPSSPSIAAPPVPVLIYGASTTVGVYATQLAKRAGLYVVGIAGKGCSHATSYGVDEIIDYRGKSTSELTSAISKAAGGRIQHVFDCISSNDTKDTIVNGLDQTGNGGKITYVLYYSDEELAAVPQHVEMIRTGVRTAHIAGEDDEFAREWFGKLGEWMEEGSFKSQKVTIIPGGLDGIKEGLRRLQEGEASSEKFVYRVKETAGL